MAKIIVPVTTFLITAGFGGVVGYYAKKVAYVFAPVKR